MLTPDQLSAIEARAESPTQDAGEYCRDVDVLIDHIREQEAEIDSLKIELHKAQIDCGLYKTEMFEQAARIAELEDKITKYKPYYDAIMWLQEHHGAARHWSRWRIEADDYSQCSDDFLEAFEGVKNVVEGEE